MAKPILTPPHRCLARTAFNLICGIELKKYDFSAYVFYSEDKSSLVCALYLKDECVAYDANYQPSLFTKVEKLDTVVRLARYTVTAPVCNIRYLEWRDSSDALVIDALLERYEQGHGDAVITLFNAYYQLQR
ncbi:hypothetical protein ACSX1A_02425 [Pontibacter sp. MBLB2868]|uniref:hypothetical protein n=1 Tax=Pontibacter sp. MBLB2868 TaxID=3451555 RepID=UPI003F756345